MSGKIIAVLGLILLSGFIVWTVCETNKRRFDTYQDQLNSIIDRVIALHTSAANMIAVNSSLSTDELDRIQQASDDFQQELDNLGSPPQELREAASALGNGLDSYQQAYIRLVEQSSNESEFQFGQEFFNLAMHAGEQIHIAVQSSVSQDMSGICVGIQNLLLLSGYSDPDYVTSAIKR